MDPVNAKLRWLETMRSLSHFGNLPANIYLFDNNKTLEKGVEYVQS